MISILSGVVLMLAIGTLVQRQDLVSQFFGDGGAGGDGLAFVGDDVEVAPDTLTRIDVLANDSGLPEGAQDQLTVLSQPGCGRVFVQAGALQFLAENDCEATQRITYSLAEASDIEPGVVVVRVRGATGTRNAPEPTRGGGIVLARPTFDDEGKEIETAAIEVERNTAPARPLPSIVLPRAGDQPAAPATNAPAATAVPQPGVPGRSQPASPGRTASPSAPQVGGGLRAPGGSLDSGLALADTSPSIGGSGAPSAPSLPGSTAPSRSPSVPGQLAGLPTPSAPSSGLPSVSAPSVPAPSIPGRSSPSAGSAPSSLALAPPSQPGARSPAQPSASAPRPAAPSLAAPSIGSPSAPSAPSAGGGTSLALAAPEPSSPSLPGSLGSGISRPQVGGQAPDVVRDSGSSAPSAVSGHGATAPAPSAIGRQATPTLALARVEVPTATAAPQQAGAESLELAGPETDTTQLNPGLSVGSVATGGAAIAFAEPTEALREIMDLRDTMSAMPLIDTTGPEALAQPDRVGDERDLRMSAISPDSVTSPSPSLGAGDAVQPEVTDAPEQIDIARLPSTELACVVPPSITLDVRAAGETDLMITSPCHADSVAELEYLKMKFGVTIDRTGRGMITMYGFETSADAALSFADDETLEFSVPFTAVERIERVALAWDAPVVLGLHALEFSAERDGTSHVRVDQPRDFGAVRRRGGGYLASFAPVEGVGQNVQIYTHWIRRGGKSGVVKMYLDFTSRHRDRLPSTCGSGEFARPSFTITRSSRGRLEEPEDRRLGAMACDDVATEQDPLIGAAVRDIIISQR
ncbi:MAG: hypothetical protein AAF371_02315 [Pseudomonadota bacterium]